MIMIFQKLFFKSLFKSPITKILSAIRFDFITPHANLRQIKILNFKCMNVLQQDHSIEKRNV